MRRIDFRSGFIPRTPLVDDQFDMMLPVVLTHDGPMLVDERLHAVRFVKQLVVFGIGELNGVAFRSKPVVRFPKTEVPRVMVQAKAVDAVEETAILFGDS